MEKKTIKIPKDFYKKLDCQPIKVPTIQCLLCGEIILDTPTNRIKFTNHNLTNKII